MRLTSRDGAYVELWPEAYQLDAPTPELLHGDADLDDWLVIRCRVRTADGGEWSFVQPCLTTDEADHLANWLAQAAAGTVTPTPAPPKPRSVDRVWPENWMILGGVEM